MSAEPVIAALRQHAPPLMRWAGAIAKRLRQFNIALTGKHSGNANTDALTLADLTVQELLVAGLRDAAPVLKSCRIEAEETTGDLAAFATESPLVISLDPIDGTKQFRDHTGNGYAVMLHLRNRETVLYSLVYAPEMGPEGTWVEAYDGVVKCGADNFQVTAGELLASLPNITPATRPDSPAMYLIGFQKRDVECARAVTKAGLKGFAPDEMPGSIYPLLATGDFGGSLIHSPNIYDFPVSLHIARVLGGDAVWVHNGQPVNFDEMWMDDRADMLRLPGIVACAVNRSSLKTLCELAKDWNPVRYVD
ncbi:Inositol monophosphatase family protein [Caulifigura coniformis]|uniref:Inositol monophosphatase family protein n=1 Tax=Caulifigura coniformis TaxID=2527983 RepID=A0A517SC01_9PLAN|nr:inositol monophosphatase family protein [Caulifigura coniformis]QDT53652.1 Inositol monophosphatase family protein [Caulifigura coniformis]